MLSDVPEEGLDWYRLSPLQRLQACERLWAQYSAQGVSHHPEPDSQRPFDFPELRGTRPVDGRPGLRVLRRGGV